MPRKTVSKRRTRIKSRSRAKRVSRRRKGGECGDITKYEDNFHCVSAGCDPLKCAKYHKASMPHKPVVDEIALLNAEIENLKLMKQGARIKRRTQRKTLRKMSQKASTTQGEKTSNLIPMLSASHDWRRFMESSSSDDE